MSILQLQYNLLTDSLIAVLASMKSGSGPDNPYYDEDWLCHGSDVLIHYRPVCPDGGWLRDRLRPA